MNDTTALEQAVIDAIKTVFDPEIPVNVYDLGLIYRIDIDENAKAFIEMTLTSPGCPVAQSLPLEVADAARSVEGISDAHVELVWDPPWSMERMSEAAKLQLGMF